MDITFKANLVSKVSVQKRLAQTNFFYPRRVSLVELDKSLPKDMFVLEQLDESWPLTYVRNIRKDSKRYPDSKIFLITEQKDNFKELNKDKILGIEEIFDTYPKECKLEYLQVNPEYEYSKFMRKYKHIGKAFLDSLKKIQKFPRIEVWSTISAMPFYKANGFVEDTIYRGLLVWEKDK